MSHLGIKFRLPKAVLPVDKRELTVVTNGASKVYTLPGSATVTDEFVFALADTYTVTLVDVDEHGNRSLPSDPLHGSIDDDIRPPKPGPFEPLEPSDKNWMSDEEAVAAKEQTAKKAAETAKATAVKAQAEAKAAEDHAAAHAKLDADAKKKSAPK